MDTKLYPTKGSAIGHMNMEPISHSPEDLRKHLKASLDALGTDSIDMFYLHGPDRSTPYIDTLRELNELYKQGKFKRLGISNYYSWEVSAMCEIAKANNWICPTAYQGIYNCVHRTAEAELFPCLRKYGLSFYEFNPLGGGLLTGRYSSAEAKADAGSRFDPNKSQGKMYRARYWNESYFGALDILQKACDKHNLTMGEIALRWVSHHSAMKREFGDNVIIGASSVKHIEENLVDLEKGPLPEDVVAAVDEAWNSVKNSGITLKYWH